VIGTLGIEGGGGLLTHIWYSEEGPQPT